MTMLSIVKDHHAVWCPESQVSIWFGYVPKSNCRAIGLDRTLKSKRTNLGHREQFFRVRTPLVVLIPDKSDSSSCM